MNFKKIIRDKRSLWIGLGLLSILLRFIIPTEVFETYYSRGFFVFFRSVVDSITNLLPFALVYILFFVVVVVFAKQAFQFYRNSASRTEKLFNFCFSTLAFLGGVIFFFMIMWGYNYNRIPLETQLGITPEPLKFEELRISLFQQTKLLQFKRNALPGITDSTVSSQLLPRNLEETMRTELKRVLKNLGYPTPGNVRGRYLNPKGLLLRINTAGVYIPFTAEGHIDPGLHHLQLPYVIAHEMAHGYGFGDEGTCNFLAWLTCISSSDPYLQYVGELAYWRNLAGDYRWFNPEEYAYFFENNLPKPIINDLKAIYAEMEKYPDIFPDLRNAIYDSYLKAQGIEEGLENYNRVLVLVQAWKKKFEN